jgi:hypothetical protein
MQSIDATVKCNKAFSQLLVNAAFWITDCQATQCSLHTFSPTTLSLYAQEPLCAVGKLGDSQQLVTHLGWLAQELQLNKLSTTLLAGGPSLLQHS